MKPVTIENISARITRIESASGMLPGITLGINHQFELACLKELLRLMESRTVTVKLPAEKFCPAEYAGSQLWSETEVWNKAITTCADVLRAAGIQVIEGEGQ